MRLKMMFVTLGGILAMMIACSANGTQRSSGQPTETTNDTAQRKSTVRLETILEAWTRYDSTPANPPATESQLDSAEAKIGCRLPSSLRKFYSSVANGGWLFELNFYPLEPSQRDEWAVVNLADIYRGYGWQIPQDVLLFADDGGEEVYGVWLIETQNSLFRCPIIEVGEIHDPDCMGLVGTDFVPFLLGWTAYYLVATQEDADPPDISASLDLLQLPQWLRFEEFDETPFLDAKYPPWEDHHFAQLRKWADPDLPDPYGDSYNQRYTVEDLRKLFNQ